VVDYKKKYISNRDWVKYWLKPGTNDTGFSAIPGGSYNYITEFSEQENQFPNYAAWWFKSKDSKVAGSILINLNDGIKIDYTYSEEIADFYSKSMEGNSIRLVKN
jgi:uncharacterized protein (TIGR02145 family)